MPRLHRFVPALKKCGMLVTIAAALALLLTTQAFTGAKLPAGKLFDRTLGAISRSYFDPSRIDARKMLDGALDQMQRRIPEILISDRDSGQLGVTVGLASKRVSARPLQSLTDLSRVMQEVLGFVLAHYTPTEEMPSEEIEYAAIDGMLEALDPHSNFLTPKVYKEFKVGTQGKFGGLGIVISIKDGYLTVVAPIEGTPASAAGIRAGDRITQIDDESTINMSLTDAVNKLRGDVGTKVALMVERQAKPTRKVLLTRAIINIESVQHRLLAAGNRRVGYLKIKNFQENTDDDVAAALADFHRDGANLDGLILDLRNDPGGLLDVAIDVADRFLKSGVIVSTVGPRNQVIDQSDAAGNGTEPDYPIAVLVNEGSASASEIVAGALAANDRAVVVGRRTFGKGSVQTVYELGGDTALKLTIAQYKPAGTETIQLTGLTPDIDLVPITVDPEAINIVEDKPVSEMDLESHLGEEPRDVARPEPLAKSAFKVPFLQPKQDEKELENRSLKEYARVPELTGDFAVEFATSLLSAAGRPTRKATLAQSVPAVKEAQAAQQQKIDAELSKAGINWQSTPASGQPKLSLQYKLYKGAEPIQRARAGDKVRLELTATNIGTGPYSQLVAVGESDSPLLEEREFPFGRLEPGMTRKFSSPIEIPESQPTQDLSMDLTFKEEHGNAPSSVRVVLPVAELPHPAFAFTVTMPTVAAGKPLPVGAPIPLSVEVQNVGTGMSSADTSATVSNECGERVFIENGRLKLGALAPKAKRRAPFSFHLTPAGNGGNGDAKESCGLKFAIADFKQLVALTKLVELKPASGQLKPSAGRQLSPPRIELNAMPTSTKEAQVTVSGTIVDTDEVKDCFLFVGEKKVAYLPNPDGSSSMPFSVVVPLEPGTNHIVIGARDSEDLMARRVAVVERTSGEKKQRNRSRSELME